MPAIRTFDGRLVDPLRVTREDVIPWVLLRSICQLNRFTGHCRHPYSVGQHTLNLIETVPLHLKKAALVHDLSEAWFNDLASPLKVAFPEYRAAEHRASAVVAEAMHVDQGYMREFDLYDKAIYINERDALIPSINDLGMGDDRVGLVMEGDYSFDEMHWHWVFMRLMHWYEKLF